MKYPEWVNQLQLRVKSPVRRQLLECFPADLQIIDHVLDVREAPNSNEVVRRTFWLLTEHLLVHGSLDLRPTAEVQTSVTVHCEMYPLKGIAHLSHTATATSNEHLEGELSGITTKWTLSFKQDAGSGSLHFPPEVARDERITEETTSRYQAFARTLTAHVG